MSMPSQAFCYRHRASPIRIITPFCSEWRGQLGSPARLCMKGKRLGRARVFQSCVQSISINRLKSEKMDYQDISFIFNRSLAHVVSKKKLLFVFCALALSGLLVVFFKGLALNAGDWVKLSLTFLPLFICAGVLLSLGILLIRIYRDEIKEREVNYWDILSTSWEGVIGASYFFIPIILCYLLLWVLLGIFVLLSEVPSAGEFFSAVLSFGPFLIVLGTLVLTAASFGILFVVAPLIAFKGLDGKAIFQLIVKRLEKDPFGNLIFLLVSLIPLGFTLTLLLAAASMAESFCLDCQNTVRTIVKWFFIMIPFTGFLTPGIVFFFNFAAEAHVLLQRQK